MAVALRLRADRIAHSNRPVGCDGNIFCLVAIFVVDDRSSLIYIFLDREIARAARVCGSDCAA